MRGWPHRLHLLVLIGLVGTLLQSRAFASAPPAIFGIVIGYNGAGTSGLESLKYADDDAAQSFLLLKELGASAVLLTELDRTSQELFPSLTALAQPPTQANLVTALSEVNRLVDRARQNGSKTLLYLFYSGHGDVEAGEGYVHLQDQRFARSDMLRLLRQSHADVNHVIVDACKSFFLIFSRGPGGTRRPKASHFLPEPQEVPANTGVFLSSSSSRDSHEWEAVQGGVFSHEMRSALRGAADLNGDGIISYEEAAAFIFTANQGISNPRFRPEFFSQPQRGRAADRAVLLDLGTATERRIVFGPKMSSHYYIENDRGLRLADLHPHQGSVSLLVPRGDLLFVREVGGGRREFSLPPTPASSSPALARLQALPARAVSTAARGAEHEAFRRLFASAFDAAKLTDYRNRPCPEEVLTAGHRRTASDFVRPALAGLALAALATGGLFSGLAARERSGIDERSSQLDRQAANQTIDRYNAVALTGYVVGGAAAATYLLWTFWPKPRAKVRVSVVPSLGGATLMSSF